MRETATDEAVNWRRTADGIELYDEANADAWIRFETEAGAAADVRPRSVCPDCGLVAEQRTAPGRYMVCDDCGEEFDTAAAEGRGHAEADD